MDKISDRISNVEDIISYSELSLYTPKIIDIIFAIVLYIILLFHLNLF